MSWEESLSNKHLAPPERRGSCEKPISIDISLLWSEEFLEGTCLNKRLGPMFHILGC
jgi:hypothetical protein